jgi:hypothetical protein
MDARLAPNEFGKSLDSSIKSIVDCPMFANDTVVARFRLFRVIVVLLALIIAVCKSQSQFDWNRSRVIYNGSQHTTGKSIRNRLET